MKMRGNHRSGCESRFRSRSRDFEFACSWHAVTCALIRRRGTAAGMLLIIHVSSVTLKPLRWLSACSLPPLS